MTRKTAHDRRWRTLGLLVFSLLVVVLDISILNVALKTLAEPKPKGLGATQSQLEWATNSYTLAFAGLLFTFGVVGDRIGRKRLLLLGLVAFGCSSALCAYAVSPQELIAFRVLLGISAAAVMPSTLSIIANVFEPAERAKAIGIWAGAVGLAIAIGPITGGILLAHFWWGSVFLINVPVCAIAVVLMARSVPESRNPNPGRLDPIGVVLSIVGIGSLVFGIIRGGDLGVGNPQTWGPAIFGFVVLAAFAGWERRYPNPIIDVSLFARRRFAGAVAVLMLIFFGYTGLLFVISFFLQAARGYSPLHTGAMLLPLAGGQLVLSSFSGHLTERLGQRFLVTSGMLMMLAVYVFYSQAGTHTSAVLLGIALLIQGAAIGVTIAPLTTSITAHVPRERAGAASAVNNTSRQVGGALGIAVLGAVLAGAYRSGIDPHLAAIPAVRQMTGGTHAASASITETLAVAGRLGKAGHAVIGLAISSFVHAMHTACAVAIGFGIVGVIVSALVTAPRSADAPGGAPTGAPPLAPEFETV